MTRQDVLLAMLAASDGREYHPVQIQKAMFLVTDKLRDLVTEGPNFDFKAYDYGAFDKDVYAEAEALKERGWASIRHDSSFGHRMYSATDGGAIVGRQILQRMKMQQRSYIERVSAWVIRLSFSKLVRSMYEAYPWTKENSVLTGIN